MLWRKGEKELSLSGIELLQESIKNSGTVNGGGCTHHECDSCHRSAQSQMATMANLTFYMYYTSKKLAYKNPRNHILL